MFQPRFSISIHHPRAADIRRSIAEEMALSREICCLGWKNLNVLPDCRKYDVLFVKKTCLRQFFAESPAVSLKTTQKKSDAQRP